MTVTTYEYDDDGRLIRTVSRPDPEWLADEVALLVASRRIEATTGPYGIPLDRALSSDAQFVADAIPTINKAVAAVEAAKDRYFKQWPNAPRAGLHWKVREVTPGS